MFESGFTNTLFNPLEFDPFRTLFGTRPDLMPLQQGLAAENSDDPARYIHNFLTAWMSVFGEEFSIPHFGTIYLHEGEAGEISLRAETADAKTVLDISSLAVGGTYFAEIDNAQAINAAVPSTNTLSLGLSTGETFDPTQVEGLVYTLATYAVAARSYRQ